MSATPIGATPLLATVMVMAGGTGGHVFPALAVAEQLRGLGARVVWLGTATGLEAERVPAAGFELHCIRVAGVRGTGWLRRATAPLMLLGALAQACVLITRTWPRLVIGFGGYASGPGGIAARLLGRRLVVHEQNAVPGLTNRVLAAVASRVLEAFPGAFPASRRAVRVGNPVRATVAAVPPPAQRLAGRGGPLRVLVVGGSQGARALDEVVPDALARLADPLRVQVRHQCGAPRRERTLARYRACGASAEVTSFIEDMAAAYAWSDIVLCRAGAMTVAEVAAAGVAALFVPFPHAVDDHQTRNAAYLADAGAALLVPERDLSVPRLAGMLAGFDADRAGLLVLAERARALALPDATQRVVAQCLEVADG